MKKKVLALVMAGLMALGLAACGGSTAPAAGSSEQTEASEDGAVSKVLEDGVLTVGTNPEFPPFEYMDGDTPTGFDMALIQAIGEKLGVEVVIESYDFDSLVESIGTKIDLAIAGMTIKEERLEKVDFSDPYYEAIQSVIVPKGSDIKSADDLKGKELGCQSGTTGDFIIQDIEGAQNHRYNRGVDAVNDLLGGKLDAVIIDRNPAAVFQGQYADQLDIVPGEDFGFEIELYAIAMPKGDTALVNAVNQALAELKEDGTFDKLVEEYITNYKVE